MANKGQIQQQAQGKGKGKSGKKGVSPEKVELPEIEDAVEEAEELLEKLDDDEEEYRGCGCGW